jgi:alpha-glucosidase
MTNLGTEAIRLPAGEILLTSGPLEDGALPPDTTAWLAPLS